MQNLDSDATTSSGHAHRMGSEGDKADDVDTPPPGGASGFERCPGFPLFDEPSPPFVDRRAPPLN